MSSSSIQCKGRDNLLQFYDKYNCDGWAIFDGKMIRAKGTDHDSLADYLDILFNAQTNAIYILKVYDGIEDRKDIKSSTECDGSVNFRIMSETEYDQIRTQQPGYIQSVARHDAVIEEIKLLRAELAAVQDEKNEPDSKLGVIGEIFETPGLAPIATQILQGILGMIFPQKQMGAIGNVPFNNSQFMNMQTHLQQPSAQPGTNTGNGGAADINSVVKELQQYDPNLLQHLQKLLIMAKDQPQNFAVLTGMLDGMAM